MENPPSNRKVVELMMGERERILKASICRNIKAPIVANMRLAYLDLAMTMRVDYLRRLKRSSNMAFLEGYRISALTPRERKSLVRSFMDDRSMLEWLIRRRFTRVIHTSLRNIFYDFVDTVDFQIHTLYRIGFCFKLEKTAKRSNDVFKYRAQNEKILHKLLTQHSQCHSCALSYLRLFYPTKSFLFAFLCDIKRAEVLEYFLQMTYKAGVDIWGPGELGELIRDPILYFMSVQRYELVHTLIDYGYTICCLKRVDKKNLISGLFGRYTVRCRPYRKFERLFYNEPYKTIMILYAMGHCNSPRTDGFLSVYERLHKSLGLPYYPTSYIRNFLRDILDVRIDHNMIEERCYVYERCGLGKYPAYSPRSLLDLATCAYRDVLKRLPCQLKTAISQLQFPDKLKDLVSLKM